MNGRRLNWSKAPFDGIKGDLVPTGEDINDYEEAELQALHEAKKGIFTKPETPTQRDNVTLDLPDPADRVYPVKSINEQVRLREERRKRRERYIQRGAKMRTKPTG